MATLRIGSVVKYGLLILVSLLFLNAGLCNYRDEY